MKIRSKQLKGIIGAMVIVFLFGIVGNMEYRQIKREEAWENSVQAWELEQENIQSRIEELKGKYERLEDMYIAQGIHISNIRERMHLDFFEDLENEVDW